jgi:hypothetical protein
VRPAGERERDACRRFTHERSFHVVASVLIACVLCVCTDAAPSQSLAPYWFPQDRELAYYQQLFAWNDRERKGMIDGITAAKFLSQTGVPKEQLRQVCAS